ncbi:MAG: 2-oxoglutarate dehydrogenase complex dihydrolipoyllysine-residue succinyltransferase [Pseudomonadota bacterium]
MSLTLKVPSIGESIREATVGVWKKAEGDWVNLDEPLVEIESEKATLEVPSPAAGVLTKILRRQGETVAIGEALADIDESAKRAGKAERKASPGGAVNGGAAVAGAAPAAAVASAAPAAALRAAPSARKLMGEAGLTGAEVQGTGRGGRIQPLDVSRALDARNGDAAGDARGPVVLPGGQAEGTRERVVPMSPMRRTIARRLVEAQQTAAILTTFNEVDMSEVLAIRERYQDRFTKQYGIKLGFMGFFVKAAIEALKAFPAVNAEVRGADVVYKDHYDIGVAVGGGKGLVVPVIRDADRLSFAEIEKTIAGLAVRAKDNKLQLAELEGGTFTISNGGIYGSMMSTPILNPPQSGILGLHAIQKRVVAVDDQVVIRPMMYLALSYDHRIVDGREAVQFLVRVKDCVETPERILLEV